jgi:hypothetical protein
MSFGARIQKSFNKSLSQTADKLAPPNTDVIREQAFLL